MANNKLLTQSLANGHQVRDTRTESHLMPCMQLAKVLSDVRGADNTPQLTHTNNAHIMQNQRMLHTNNPFEAIYTYEYLHLHPHTGTCDAGVLWALNEITTHHVCVYWNIIIMIMLVLLHSRWYICIRKMQSLVTTRKLITMCYYEFYVHKVGARKSAVSTLSGFLGASHTQASHTLTH